MSACAKAGFAQTALCEPENTEYYFSTSCIWPTLATVGAWQVNLCQGNKCHLSTSVISKIYLCAGVFACARCMACPRRPEEGVMSPGAEVKNGGCELLCRCWVLFKSSHGSSLLGFLPYLVIMPHHGLVAPNGH